MQLRRKKIHLLLSLTLIYTKEYIKRGKYISRTLIMRFQSRHLYLESAYEIKEERDRPLLRSRIVYLGCNASIFIGYYTVARRQYECYVRTARTISHE